jgi:hypothetical protein
MWNERAHLSYLGDCEGHQWSAVYASMATPMHLRYCYNPETNTDTIIGSMCTSCAWVFPTPVCHHTYTFLTKCASTLPPPCLMSTHWCTFFAHRWTPGSVGVCGPRVLAIWPWGNVGSTRLVCMLWDLFLGLFWGCFHSDKSLKHTPNKHMPSTQVTLSTRDISRPATACLSPPYVLHGLLMSPFFKCACIT